MKEPPTHILQYSLLYDEVSCVVHFFLVLFILYKGLVFGDEKKKGQGMYFVGFAGRGIIVNLTTGHDDMPINAFRVIFCVLCRG